MKKLHTGFRLFAIVAGVAFLAVSGFASADPPSRVARLGFASGAVSFSPAGEEDWVQATINRPLTTGDRLWLDAGARAEVQVGGAMVRMNDATSVAVLNLDDSITQLQLTQGTLNVRVRRLDPNQVIEIDTPNLAFTVRQPGDYRVMVDADGNATSIYVRKGQGEVYGEGASYVVDARQPYRFTGIGLQQYEPLAVAGLDDFDRWAIDRDRGYDTSISARYVSPDVVGYQDLDTNGTWRTDATYGNVWFPNRVAAGWAPYRDGHWAWVDPWGWTWVDDAPWGFAVSHYGRWASVRGSWGWIPGPVRSRAYYAPALVAFVGGNGFSLSISGGNVGGIAWFPLGPREVYRPSYAVSRRYFENVNISNTVINTTVINNYYNNTNVTNVTYVNRQVPGAIVAVPTTAFVQSQPVNRSAVRVTQQMVANAPVANVAAVAPTERSVRGAAAQREKPPARVERPVVAHTAPPAAPTGFAAQQQQLAATPGKPLDDAERKQVKRPDRAAEAAPVKVIAQPKATPPTAPPPAATAANRPEGRGKDAQRGTPAAGPPPARVAVPNAPATPPQSATPTPPVRPQVAGRPPAAAEPAAKAEQAGKADEQRAQQEQRRQDQQRAREAARAPAAPQAAAPAPSVPPQQQREAAQQQQQQRAGPAATAKGGRAATAATARPAAAAKGGRAATTATARPAAATAKGSRAATTATARPAAATAKGSRAATTATAQAQQQQQKEAAQQQQQRQAQQQQAQQQREAAAARQPRPEPAPVARPPERSAPPVAAANPPPAPKPASEARPTRKGEEKKKDVDEEGKPKG